MCVNYTHSHNKSTGAGLVCSCQAERHVWPSFLSFHAANVEYTILCLKIVRPAVVEPSAIVA